VVTVIDIEHRLILHLVSFVGIIIGIVLGFTAHGLRSTLIGGAAGFGIMATLYLFGIIFVRMLSRWVKPIDEIALGFGDVNLGIVTGLLLGWPGIIVGILITILVSGAVSLLYLIYSLVRRSYRPTMVFPLGPFLVLSIIILLYLK
jgi:Flp pilus assembly protein protease CpaA